MMKPTITPRSRRVVTPHEAWRPIIRDVAAAHNIHPRDMPSGWKADHAVRARHELWWRLHRRGASLAEIGRRLGGFDHTTVSHGVRVWEKREGETA